MTKKKTPVVDESALPALPTSLYDLTTEYLDLVSTLEQTEGEITQEQEDALDALVGGKAIKFDNYYRIRQLLLRREGGLADEITQLQARKKVTTNAIDRLERLIRLDMERMQQDTLYGTIHTISEVGVGGKRKVVIDTTPDNLPPELRKVTVTTAVDADKMREWLEEAAEDGDLMKKQIAVAGGTFDMEFVRLPDGTIHLCEPVLDPASPQIILATLQPRGTRLAWK
jgi:hypothetical protein